MIIDSSVCVCVCQRKPPKFPCICICDKRWSEQVLTQMQFCAKMSSRIALCRLISINAASAVPLLPCQRRLVCLEPGYFQQNQQGLLRRDFSLWEDFGGLWDSEGLPPVLLAVLQAVQLQPGGPDLCLTPLTELYFQVLQLLHHRLIEGLWVHGPSPELVQSSPYLPTSRQQWHLANHGQPIMTSHFYLKQACCETQLMSEQETTDKYVLERLCVQLSALL